jgi:hypothetical protein
MALADRIAELNEIIAGNDGSNAVDERFARAVDELVSSVFDDVAHIKHIPTRALFELFVIKVLYVGRRSRHADIIRYLGELLDTRLHTSALYPSAADGRPGKVYLSDVLQQSNSSEGVDNRFEAYRGYADNALFISGVFAGGARPRRPTAGMLRRQRTPGVDSAYYVTTGKAMYRLAASEEEAERTQRRNTLARLADCFEIYVDALNEMSERYIMGFDMDLIATKMLDAFNRYRQSQDAYDLRNARRYAAILRVDNARFPALFVEQGGP